MSDDSPAPSKEEIPQALAREHGKRSFPFVWIIPVVALVIGGWIALKQVLEQGPTITIQFSNAEGIEAGKTKIRHKAVEIGIVKTVKLSPDNKAAVVTAEMDRHSASAFLKADSQFWVVRPRIAGGQISGLTTLLAGSYIGAEPGKSGEEQRDFTGLETPPVITSDVPGSQYVLVAENLGSLDVNSPVYYRGVLAGRVVSADLAPDGKLVQVGVFIQRPFDKFVNEESRFWNESGVDLSVDAAGIKVETESLLTLLVGGIAFETPPDTQASAVAANAKFTLFENRTAAMKPHDTVIQPVVMKYTQSVRGLAVGAPLDFRGITAGEVRRIDLEYDPQNVRFLIVVEANIYPERLRSRYRDPARRALPELTPAQRLERFIEHGFRAQLRSANLITGQQYVALDFFPKAPPAPAHAARDGVSEIPTISGGFGELQESLQNLASKLEKVPFDKLSDDLHKALTSLDATLKKADALVGQIQADLAPELRATLEQARKTLGSAERALGSDSPLQGDLRESLIEVTKAAESLRALTDYLERHPESLIRGKRPGETKK